MSDGPTAVVVYLSGHARGKTQRLSGHRLRIGTDIDADIRVMAHELPPGPVEPSEAVTLGTLEHRGGSYELKVEPNTEIWVNGEKVEEIVLASGDVLEVGEGGPVLRFRLYKSGSRPYKSMSEVFSDCRDCARHGGRNAFERAGILLAGAPMELVTQTSPVVRVGVVMLAALLIVTGTMWIRNFRLERRLAAEAARVHGLAKLLESAQDDSFTVDELAAARADLETQLSDTLARVEALEDRAGSRERVIALASRSVVFLQGAYGFVETDGGKPLRFAPPTGDAPPTAEPQVTLEGDGPVVEVYYTGTGFVATGDGYILTNRHVAVPWDYDEIAQIVLQQGFTPVMSRFAGYLPGIEEPFEVELVRSSATADVALLRCEAVTGGIAPLELTGEPPHVGEEVIVLGYPTGMQALLARAEPSFVKQLLDSGPLDFWSLARGLSAGGHIAPLATVGIVGQVTPGSIVYDAETTHGGSGGPVLSLAGRVVAVNAAVVPEFGGSNLGVPAGAAALLLIEPAVSLSDPPPPTP